MTDAPLDIQRIVEEVLRELGALAQTVPAPAPPAASVAPPAARVAPPAAAPAGPKPLVLTGSVITLSHLSGLAEGVRQVVVPVGSVVTPAVRDELDRRRVRLVTASATASAVGERLRLVLVAAGKSFDPASLAGALRGSAAEVETHSTDCLMAASDRLAAEVAKKNTLGALVTRHPAAALCLANRLAGVRAIWGVDPAMIQAAAEDVGANVLIVDPQSRGLFVMKRMLTEFTRGGVRLCPEVFAKRLG
jgi:hypothetical protein